MGARLRTPNTLILMVGLPYSGKTSRARMLLEPIVNPDSVRLALHGQRFATRAEPMVWAICHVMVDALFIAGHTCVILDATNTTAKRRTAWDPGPDSCYSEVKCLVMDTSPEECRRRAVAVDDTAILEVIERMAGQWDLPVHWKEEAHA